MTAPDTDTLAGLLDYDPGLLNDWGGGNVEWWQDYLRAEIGRANDHWRIQARDLSDSHAAMIGNFAERTADDIAALRAQGAKDKARIERLEAALRFYGDISDYHAPLTGGLGKLFFDCGQVARAALEDME